MKPRFKELQSACCHFGGKDNDHPLHFCHYGNHGWNKGGCSESTCPIWQSWAKEQSDAEARLEIAEGLLMDALRALISGYSPDWAGIRTYLRSVGKLSDNAGGGE